MNDVKPFRDWGEVTYHDLYGEFGPDYEDLSLDDEDEPGVMLLASCLDNPQLLYAHMFIIRFGFYIAVFIVISIFMFKFYLNYCDILTTCVTCQSDFFV